MSSRHVRAYAVLLRLYPRRFRTTYRREMTLLFAQQLEDARSGGKRADVFRLWVRCLLDLIATAPSEHLERDVLVAQPVVGTEGVTRRSSRAERVSWMIAALAPATAIVFVIALSPSPIGPMFEKPPDAFGFPLGFVIAACCVFWYGLGVAIVGIASRPLVRLAALLVFVAPSTFFLVLGPGIILMLQNLASEGG